MVRVKAMELLEDPHYRWQLSMDGFHRLLLLAGYSEESAQKEASRHGWERLSAGEVM